MQDCSRAPSVRMPSPIDGDQTFWSRSSTRWAFKSRRVLHHRCTVAFDVLLCSGALRLAVDQEENVGACGRTLPGPTPGPSSGKPASRSRGRQMKWSSRQRLVSRGETLSSAGVDLPVGLAILNVKPDFMSSLRLKSTRIRREKSLLDGLYKQHLEIHRI